MSETEIIDLFRQLKFRATPQRVAVFKYLRENPVHPDADQIYKNVLKANPAFSKTTVYNALEALEQNNLITKIQIDKDRIRYDGCTDQHGHFICSKCNQISDFTVEKIVYSGIDDFSILKSDAYFYGICSNCKK